MNLKDIFNIFKSEEQIRAEMPLAEVVPLLKQKIANAKDNNETIIFTITGVKKTGFQVKTKGIYAFVPFKLMPFAFTLDIWDFIKYELINASFFAQVSDLDLENNRIILDATITKFDEFYLTDSQTYKAIILIKYPRFVVVELGHRYNWKFGSLCYLIHFDSPNYLEINYSTDSISDEISLTYIKSAHNWKKITFEKDILTPQNYFETEEAIALKYDSIVKNLKLEKKVLNAKIEKILTELKSVTTHNFDKEKEIQQLKKQLHALPNINEITKKLENEKQITKQLTKQIKEQINSSEHKNAEKIITMLENLKAKSSNQKIQITNLENQLKESRNELVNKNTTEINKVTEQLERKQGIIETQEKIIALLQTQLKEYSQNEIQ